MISLQGTDLASYDTAMTQFLSARPDLKEVEAIPGGGVQARFVDGPLLLVTHKIVADPIADQATAVATAAEDVREPVIATVPAPSTTASPLAAPRGAAAADTAVDLPMDNDVRVLNTFDPRIGAHTAMIAAMLSANGYRLGNSGATLEDLKTIQRVGVVYLDAHGAVFKTGTGAVHVFLASNTPATLENVRTYDKEMGDNDGTNVGDRLAYGLTDGRTSTGLPGMVPDGYFMFSELFIADHWKLGRNSFVFINACEADHPLLKQALFGVGASVVAAWDKSVDNNIAIRAGELVMDRLLGANRQFPEADGPQRAFDYTNVAYDLQRHGFDTDGSARLRFTAGGGEFGLLAPTIAFLGVDEMNHQLTINGLFGTMPGKVTIGGTEVAVKSWGFRAIVADLPDDLAGDVVVEVREHKSNAVQLTAWDAHFVTTFVFDPDKPLRQDGTIDVHIRADVHSHRDRPHDKPIDPIVPFRLTHTSKGQFTASGTFVAGDVTVTWSGTSEILLLDDHPDPPNRLVSFGQIDVAQRRLSLALFAGATEGMTITATGPGGTNTFHLPGVTGLLDGNYAPDLLVPALQLTIDDAFVIPGGVREQLDGSAVTRLEWQAIAPSSPPDPTAAR
jgi:hypothetical protein